MPQQKVYIYVMPDEEGLVKHVIGGSWCAAVLAAVLYLDPGYQYTGAAFFSQDTAQIVSEVEVKLVDIKAALAPTRILCRSQDLAKYAEFGLVGTGIALARPSERDPL